MSAQLTEVSGKLLTIKISGVLQQPEYLASQQQAGDWIDQHGAARFLLILENFHGTAQEGDWSDFSFPIKYDALIEKIAIVSESRWRDAAFMFTGKGLRPMPIQHFTPDDLNAATEWAMAE